MPLKPGKKNIGANIKEMIEHGHPQKQAVAAALDKARKGKKRRGSLHDRMVETVMMKARKKRESKVRSTLGKKKMKHPELRGRVKP